MVKKQNKVASRVIYTAFYQSMFAVVWWLILYGRGDFQAGHLPDEQEANNWQPCVLAMHDFASCFLFSVETQHTVGQKSKNVITDLTRFHKC